MKNYVATLLKSVFLVAVLLLHAKPFAQITHVPCNTYRPIVTTTSPASSLNVSDSGFQNNTANLINSSLTDATTWNYATVVVAKPTDIAWIEVKDNFAINDSIYPIGTYAGFVVDASGISIGGSSSTVISTYKGTATTPEESYTVSSSTILSLDPVSGGAKIGFITTKPFDRLRITFTISGLITSGTKSVYYAELFKPCAGAIPACNINIPLVQASSTTQSNYPVFIQKNHTGITGITLLSGVANPDNVVNSNTTADSATIVMGVLAVDAIGSISVRDLVTDLDPGTARGYPAGYFAGFEVSSTSLLNLGLLTRSSVTTYLNGVRQDSVSSSSLLVDVPLLSSIGHQTIGFVTTKPFDEVRYSIFQPAGVNLGTTNVFKAVIKRFCVGPSLACNTKTSMGAPTFPMIVNGVNTKITGVCVNCAIKNADYAIDEISTTAAEISLTAGILASGSFSVKDQLTDYPAGMYAGFDIENPALVGVNVLSGISLTTFLNGDSVQSFSAGSLVAVSSSLLSGTGRQTIGALSTLPFDEIRITVNQTGLNLGTTKIYNAVFEKFCLPPALVCNTLITATNPVYPVYIDNRHTGIGAVACVGCSLNNTERVVDQDSSNYATLVLAAGVGVNGSLTVADALTMYEAGTFAGFDIGSSSLLNAGVLESITITLLRNDTIVQTGTGTGQLVSANVPLLTGNSTRSVLGIVSSARFNKVQITFSNIVDLDLGTVLIYNAIFQKACAGTISCNSTFYLSSPNYPVVIEGSRTGLSGAVCALCSVDSAWNVLTPSASDHARISLVAGVLTTGSISVRNQVDVYPAGTVAGFTVKDSNNFLQVNLLTAITITTYLNGVQRESRTAGQLLNLDAIILFIGVGNGVSNVGFTTSKSWNEVRITYSNVLGAISYLDVYSAYVDTRFVPAGTAGLDCNYTLPDFNVTTVNVPVLGNVSTNDKIVSGTTYATPTALPGYNNPSSSAPIVNANGSYTFTSATVGVYQYYVPVCNASVCKNELLTITVIDSGITVKKPPIANLDVSVTSINTAVIIHSLENDGIGTVGSSLLPATITLADLNGSATGNTVRGGTATANTTTGNITYTPPTDFVGVDTVRYTICDNQTPSMCGSAYQIVTVLPVSSNTTLANDDFVQTDYNIATTGNVKTNDTDPEGNTQTVTSKDTTIAGKGRLVLLSSGQYTFTPVEGFYGSVDIPYNTCDNGIPQACAMATLHILVRAGVPDLTPRINLNPNNIIGSNTVEVTVQVNELKNAATNGAMITMYVDKLSSFGNFAFSNTKTVNAAGQSVQNSLFTIDNSNLDFYIIRTNAVIMNSLRRVTFSITIAPGQTKGSTPVNVYLINNSGGEGERSNNSDITVLTFSF